MESFEIYSGGQFRKSGDQLSIKNPYSGGLVALVYKACPDDLEFAIDKALSIEEEMADLPSYKRYEALMQIADGLEKNKERFTRLICLEAGKPWKYSTGEVERAIATFVAAAEEAKRLPKEYLNMDWTAAGEGKEGFVRYFPLGLVSGISPFNFPLNLAVHKIAPAIAAACPVILKPSTSTPLSTLELAKIIDRTSLPKGAVSVLPLDRVSGNQLVTDERFKLMTFTGSPDVGWKMKNEAGRKRVVLELGGNAGVIVTASADIPYAVKRCIMGAFSYSGQVCIHAQRIYVENRIYEEFTKTFIEAAGRLIPGDPLDPQTDISSMIDEENAIRVEKWVNEALEGGSRLLAGGTRTGTYFPPTILSGTDPSMKVCALEVFGPVVTLEKYNHFDEAVHHINHSVYGLQAGVFTNLISEMNLAFRHIKVGGLIVNDVPTFRVDHMPYGGVKSSGFGREGVKYSILDMMEPRLLVKNMK